jgi:hypothetical protein
LQGPFYMWLAAECGMRSISGTSYAVRTMNGLNVDKLLSKNSQSITSLQQHTPSANHALTAPSLAPTTHTIHSIYNIHTSQPRTHTQPRASSERARTSLYPPLIDRKGKLVFAARYIPKHKPKTAHSFHTPEPSFRLP